MKYIVYQKESFIGSATSDLLTFGLLIFCIWFSKKMGGGFYTELTSVFLFFSLLSQMNIKTGQITKVHSKQEAIDWANSLEDNQE